MFKKCLVLGGSGFLGSHLIDSLLENNIPVKSFSYSKLPIPKQNDLFEAITGDFLNNDDLNNAMKGCDVCIHLITTTLPSTSDQNIVYDIQSNLVGTIQVLDAAVKYGVKNFIFVSSGGTVYGAPNYIPIDEKHDTAPLSSYGITKLTIEKFIGLYRDRFDLNVKVMRLANPYGARQKTNKPQGVIAAFLENATLGKPLKIWGDGSIIRDYIYIDDVVSAMLKMLFNNSNEWIFNIGSGVGTSLLELAEMVKTITNSEIDINFQAARHIDVQQNILDITRSAAELNWVPKTKIYEGIELMYKHSKKV